MAIILANNANGNLARSITEAATSIQLQTGQGARQARIQHDGAVGALTGSAKGGEYRADRQRFGADGQAKRGG